MVTPARETVRAGRLHPLAQPQPISVEADADNRPLTLVMTRGKGRGRVVAIRNTWLLEDEWWRPRPVKRRYWAVELEGGAQRTVFQDLLDGTWYYQP